MAHCDWLDVDELDPAGCGDRGGVHQVRGSAGLSLQRQNHPHLATYHVRTECRVCFHHLLTQPFRIMLQPYWSLVMVEVGLTGVVGSEGRSEVIKAHTSSVRDVDISPDSQLMLSCSDDKSVKAGSRHATCPHANFLKSERPSLTNCIN